MLYISTFSFLLCSYSFVFHYVVERGIIYLCLADEKEKRRIPFLFLEEIKGKFQQSYGDRAATAIAFAMNADFARVLQERMVSINNNTIYMQICCYYSRGTSFYFFFEFGK